MKRLHWSCQKHRCAVKACTDLEGGSDVQNEVSVVSGPLPLLYHEGFAQAPWLEAEYTMVEDNDPMGFKNDKGDGRSMA